MEAKGEESLWAEMARARKAGKDYNKIFASLPAFTNPETEMLPTVVNWIGGKNAKWHHN